MDTTDPLIEFDENGICMRCKQFYNDILPMWNYGRGKEDELNELMKMVKEDGKHKEYDCLLGLSGGLDSSFMLHLAVTKLGLKPLVFHVDGGWDAEFAKENIDKMIKKLGVKLHIEKINWAEMREFQLAMFKSGVPHLDIPQDHAFVAVLDEYASKYKIKYILNGENISTEVISNPRSWSYWGTDIWQIKDILKRYAKIRFDTYPFTNIFKRKVVMPYIKGVRVLKILNYIPYFQKEAEDILIKEYNWQPYPQKHFESIFTKFLEGYWLPERFGYDVRKQQYSSLILTGQMRREEALERLKKKPLAENEAEELFEYVAKKLEISVEELEEYFKMPKKTYKDYRNIKKFIDFGAKIMYLLKLDKRIRR
jgi:N-acetyl sugar amidotransferase